MDDISALETRLAAARKERNATRAKVNKLQKRRAELLVKVRELNPQYAMSIEKVNRLEKELSALMGTDVNGQHVAIKTASEGELSNG